MHVTIEDVTPAKAASWLEANKSNRALRKGVAEKYAADMRAGNWTQCTAPIGFYDDGDLADGQHRLFAVLESDTTQRFIVARGLSRKDGLNIDTGLMRSLIDNAKISGEDNSVISHQLVGTARAIEFGNIALKRTLSNAEALEVVDRHRAAATFACSIVKKKQGLCGAVVTASIGRAYLCGVDHDTLRRFAEVFGTGFSAMGESESAAIAMRNYMIEKGAVVSTSSMWRDTFLKVQNAISYFAQGRRLTVIKKVSEESYPLPKPKRAAPAATSASSAKHAAAGTKPVSRRALMAA